MSPMNFSVPADVKKQFDKAFAGKNKSAVLTRLMQQAIEERKREDQRKHAIDHLLALRQQVLPVKTKGSRNNYFQEFKPRFWPD